jgi:hypothetical protein
MASEVYTRLLNEGPLPASIVRKPNPSEREDGIQKFNPFARSGHGSAVMHTERVLYIDGKHTAESVLVAYMDCNKPLVNGTSDWQLHHRFSEYGDEFKKASRALLEPERPGGQNQPTGEMEESPCPLCGEPVKVLAKHLPCGE